MKGKTQRATVRLRKKIREQRRLATQIKDLVNEALAAQNTPKHRSVVEAKLLSIFELADKMDARTGTTDPSTKEGFHSGKSGEAKRPSIGGAER